MKKVEVSNESEVSFNISSSDVDSNTPYYGFISPADMFDVVGAPSKEVCFQIANNLCLQDSECNTLGALAAPKNDDNVVEEEMHGAAGCV
jgi:hypothetical protein